MSNKAFCIDLKDLHKACKFSICVDPKKRTIKLNAKAKVKDSNGNWKSFDRTINITPLVQQLNAKLNEIENMQSPYANDGTVAAGDLSVTVEHAGGWLSDTYSKAVRIARKIAENRIVKDIYEDVLPEVAPYIPGGTAALNIANKAHDVFVKARAGSQEAIEKVHSLVEAAKTSPAARQVVGMMHRMKQLMDMKRAYGADAVSGDALPDMEASYDLPEDEDDEDLELEGDEGDDRVEGWRWIWQDDRPRRRRRVHRPDPDRDDCVEGWLYNKPYRDPMTAMLQANKDPGNIHRFLYNRGMGRAN